MSSLNWSGNLSMEFAEILAQGIEYGLEALEYIMDCGETCERCGEWRICLDTEVREIGGEPDEVRVMIYRLCDDCFRGL